MMEKKRAVELLIQEVDKIPHLKTLSPSNDEFRLWLKHVGNIVNEGLEPEDKSKFREASQFLSFIRGAHENDLIKQDYIKEIVRYEIAVKSIVQKYEILGLVTKSDTNKQHGEIDMQTGESFKSVKSTSWKDIESEFGVTKTGFGKNMNFVSDPFKRTVIFRDVQQAFILASLGFPKPAMILAGGVIEELLRLYLGHKNITPINDSFDGYIQTCEQKGLLKAGISRLSDSARYFRNLVHLSKEETKRHTISKATAKGAVASIFTIANDF